MYQVPETDGSTFTLLCFIIMSIYHHHHFIDFYYVQLSEDREAKFFLYTLSEGLLWFLASQQQEIKESCSPSTISPL